MLVILEALVRCAGCVCSAPYKEHGCCSKVGGLLSQRRLLYSLAGVSCIAPVALKKTTKHPNRSFQNSGALIWTPSSRPLVVESSSGVLHLEAKFSDEILQPKLPQYSQRHHKISRGSGTTYGRPGPTVLTTFWNYTCKAGVGLQ